VISRVADGCFWLGRYLERAESTARLLATTRALALDGELTAMQAWSSVLHVAGEQPVFVARHGDAAQADGELVERTMTWDREASTCIACSIASARENGRSVGEVLSGDVWESINELYLWMKSEAAEREYADSRDGFYRRVRDGVQLSLGLMRSTMLHDEPLDFAWLGLLLERVGQTARILDVHHHAFSHLPAEQYAKETGVWTSLLYAVSAYEAYLRAHAGFVQADHVARFLVLDERFPRSVRYSVSAALDRLRSLRPTTQPDLPGRDADARLSALDGWVRSLDALAPGDVHDVLTRVVDETSDACEAIGRELLGYGEADAPSQSQSQS
jgi:uncharacterized alpha-E superfamily protein